MSRLSLLPEEKAFTDILNTFERRIKASGPGLCKVNLTRAILAAYHAQSCGKCTPCRIGGGQILSLLDDILDHKATEDTLKLIQDTAKVIATSSDCEVGTGMGNMILFALDSFKDDFLCHIQKHHCTREIKQIIPCVAKCPAGVDIPGYIALVNRGKYKDAVRLIRKDNPFPTACAYVCEHPCEQNCRRLMVDDAINIRGMKAAAVRNVKKVDVPQNAPSTKKKIAIVGGGPSGLSCAYYLSLMGHSVTIYEANEKLGGMLYYGIPRYRLPEKELKKDIDAILSTGVKVECNKKVGSGDLTIDKLKKEYDAIYIAIGAQNDKKAGIDGEDAPNVYSAVELLHKAGDGKGINLKGKRVIVIGGGNVAMDCTRTAIRLGALSVSVVYRRRKEDMSAQREEVEASMREGAEILELNAPLRIEKDRSGKATALVVAPKLIGMLDKNGRPTMKDLGKEERHLEADVIIIAIGQGIDASHFEESGVDIKKGIVKGVFSAEIDNTEGIFSGGDCVTGPATAIRAIAAGKVAAANIDEFLGFKHEISVDVNIPEPVFKEIIPCARINIRERRSRDAKDDFECVELPLTEDEIAQESSRCLRCDRFGLGAFKGGRTMKW